MLVEQDDGCTGQIINYLKFNVFTTRFQLLFPTKHFINFNLFYNLSLLSTWKSLSLFNNVEINFNFVKRFYKTRQVLIV